MLRYPSFQLICRRLDIKLQSTDSRGDKVGMSSRPNVLTMSFSLQRIDCLLLRIFGWSITLTEREDSICLEVFFSRRQDTVTCYDLTLKNELKKYTFTMFRQGPCWNQSVVDEALLWDILIDVCI